MGLFFFENCSQKSLTPLNFPLASFSARYVLTKMWAEASVHRQMSETRTWRLGDASSRILHVITCIEVIARRAALVPCKNRTRTLQILLDTS